MWGASATFNSLNHVFLLQLGLPPTPSPRQNNELILYARFNNLLAHLLSPIARLEQLERQTWGPLLPAAAANTWAADAANERKPCAKKTFSFIITRITVLPRRGAVATTRSGRPGSRPSLRPSL